MSNKLFNPANFENLLPKINLTSTEIFDSIYNYDLPLWDIRLDEIENDKKLPIFVKAFYDFILKYQVIPTSDEFYNYYIDVYNKDFFNNNNNNYNEYLLIGLRSRVYRLYPSLVREFHFTKLVYECFDKNCYEVIYNIELDVYEGIDLMIYNKVDNKYFGINLFVDTCYSKWNKVDKKNRHSSYENVTYVDLPINLKGDDIIKCNNFILYGYNSYHELIKNIEIN